MPAFPFSRAMTANQLGLNPLTDWQFERVPAAWVNGAVVSILLRATTTGVRVTTFAGSTTIQQRSPVQGGGTAGVTPSRLNTEATEFIAAPDDKILIQLDEVAAGTPTVDGIVVVEPL